MIFIYTIFFLTLNYSIPKLKNNNITRVFFNHYIFYVKNWNQNGAKTIFKSIQKELRGDTNADFYLDKTTNEILLKSNKSGNWINTGHFLN